MNGLNQQYPIISNRQSQPDNNNYSKHEITNVNINQNRIRQNLGNYQQRPNENFSPFAINYQPLSIQTNNNRPAFRAQYQPNQLQPSNQPNPIHQSQENNQNRIINQTSLYRDNPLSIFYKMDGIFAQSFTSLKKQLFLHTFIVFTLLLAVLLLYKLDIFKQNQGQIHGVILQDGQLKQSVIPFLILAQSLIIIFKLVIYFNTYHKLDFALYVCKLIDHAVLTQIADESLSFNDNISQVYLLTSTEITYEQGMQQSIKNLHKQVTMNQIRVCIKTKECCPYQLHELFEFGMFVCAVYLIAVLAQDQTTWIEKMVLITTIVYWFLQNYKLIIYTLILLLCPLVTLGIIIYACFISSTPRRQLKIPQAVNPTNQQIINCGGTCSICMMQFNPTQSVIFLPCSNKHMFHQLCIKGWLNLKTTCPNCRFDLTTS